MAVYTPLEADEVQTILTAFGAGRLVGFAPIAEGIENTNYRVEAGRRSFVLTVFERTPADQAEGTLRLAGELADRGVACPRPLAGARGVLGALRGKPAALVPFVSGRVARTLREPELEALGRATARLHKAGERLPFDRAGPHLARVLGPLARGLADRVGEADPALADLLRDEASYQEEVPEQGLPAGVIHADLFRDNVLFAPEGDEVAAFLDLHLAGRGPWLYDLAVVLLDAGWAAGAVVGDRARALLRGYRSVRPLEGPEYAALPAYLRRAALRFLCLRLERFLLDPAPMAAGRAKDPGELAARLRALRALGGGGGRG